MSSQPGHRGATGSERAPNAAGSSQGEALLEEFSDAWKVHDDVVDEAVVRDVTSERCERRVETSLHADELVETRQYTESEYREAISNRVAFSARYGKKPTDYTERVVEFVEHDAPTETCPTCGGQEQIDCPTCDGGFVDCDSCGGLGSQSCHCNDGRVACDGCDGTGEVRSDGHTVPCINCDGDGTFECPNCEGKGEYDCPECEGDGTQLCDECDGSTHVECHDCEGAGEHYHAKAGRIDFTTTEAVEAESRTGMPVRPVEQADGTKRDETTTQFDPPMEGGNGVLRQTVEYFDVPTTEVEYEFEGQNFRLYEVDGEFHAPDYPMSVYRALAPYAAVFAAALIVIGMLI